MRLLSDSSCARRNGGAVVKARVATRHKDGRRGSKRLGNVDMIVLLYGANRAGARDDPALKARAATVMHGEAP